MAFVVLCGDMYLRYSGAPLRPVLLAILALLSSCLPHVAGQEISAPSEQHALPSAGIAMRLPTEPDLFGWDPGSRGNLYRLHREGVVAVRYEVTLGKTQLELLSNCIGTAEKYHFTAYAETKKKIAHNANELFAELPVGAATLSGKLTGSRVLRTDYMLLGIASIPPGTTYYRNNLRGPDCARATHVVTSIHFGGFAMAAGDARKLEAVASVFSAGAGIAMSGDVEEIDRAGIVEECEKAQKTAVRSQQCDVPLRIQLMPLEAAISAAPQLPAPNPTPPQPPAEYRPPAQIPAPVQTSISAAIKKDLDMVIKHACEECKRLGATEQQACWNEYREDIRSIEGTIKRLPENEQKEINEYLSSRYGNEACPR